VKKTATSVDRRGSLLGKKSGMPPPPPLPLSLKFNWELNMLICIASVFLFFGVIVALNHFNLPAPKCSWKAVTGVPCAGCGGTRAGTLLLSGDLVGALAINPLATIIAIVSIALAGYSACVLMGLKKPIRFGLGSLPVNLPLLAIAIIVANWIYLLIAGIV
jgi:hypothetical protein